MRLLSSNDWIPLAEYLGFLVHVRQDKSTDGISFLEKECNYRRNVWDFLSILLKSLCLFVDFQARATNIADESSRVRVSTETRFGSKQPKLEPKLVSALSETRQKGR
jgi:hypothetical protein